MHGETLARSITSQSRKAATSDVEKTRVVHRDLAGLNGFFVIGLSGSRATTK
jgi:hypothetical protein